MCVCEWEWCSTSLKYINYRHKSITMKGVWWENKWHITRHYYASLNIDEFLITSEYAHLRENISIWMSIPWIFYLFDIYLPHETWMSLIIKKILLKFTSTISAASHKYRLDIMFGIWILNGIYTHIHKNSFPLRRENYSHGEEGHTKILQLKSFFYFYCAMCRVAVKCG